MEKFWDILVAIFFLLIAANLILLAYVFQNSVITVIGFYGGLLMLFLGAARGALTLIDHKKDDKGE